VEWIDEILFEGKQNKIKIYLNFKLNLNSHQEKKRYELLQVKHKLEMLLTYHQKLLLPPTKYAKTIGGIDPSAVLRNELRSVVLAKIEEGRRQLGQDLIVKTDEGDIANEGNTPTMQLYKKVPNLRAIMSTITLIKTLHSTRTCNMVSDCEESPRKVVPMSYAAWYAPSIHRFANNVSNSAAYFRRKPVQRTIL
jgi:hypothetical protein